MWLRWTGLWCGLLLAVCASACDSPTDAAVDAPAPQPGEAPPSSPALRLALLATPAGALQPCGCQPDMRGGLDHLAALLRQQGADGVPHLLLAAGAGLFDASAAAPDASPALRAQALHKARVLAEGFSALGLAAWVPGESDHTAGAEAYDQLVAASGASALVGARATRVVERGGVRVGVSGLRVGDAPAPPAHLVTALRRALRAQTGRGAQLHVLLATGGRRGLRAALRAVPGFDVAVLGAMTAPPPESTPLAVRDLAVGTTRVVMPDDRLQQLALVDVRRGNDGALSLDDVRLLDVREAAGSDPAMAARMAAYDAELRRLNAVQPGDAGPAEDGPYAGAMACKGCHDAAHAFWNNTPHAVAWVTLRSRHKTHDLECVPCHVTGHGMPGGVAGVSPGRLQAVQCEACHGPAARHATTAKREDVVRKPERTLCAASCHHPPHVGADWDVDVAWERILGPGHAEAR